jgi:hypothetical protein
MTEQTQTPQEAPEQMAFTVPWAEKREEFGELANEEMIAQAWDVNENLIFFFLMWLGTY